MRAVFDGLDDDPLIGALIGPIRRGQKGYPVRVLWHCFIAKYVMGLSSTAALIRTLENNPFVAEACGISSPEAIPHKSTFSRFFAKLAHRKYLPLVKDVSRALVRKHYATLPGFGKRVAIDSTTLKGWVNGGKPKPSDPEAKWSVKNNTHGKKEFVLGWKLHLLVDCEFELPIAANVTPGNTSDVTRATNLLSEARRTYSRFLPRYLMADQGYSGRPLFKTVHQQFKAIPIILVNRTHKRLKSELGEFQKTEEFRALYSQRQAVERA